MTVQLCTDCGTRPIWWWAWTNYCKRCATKGGQPYGTMVDPDAVLAFFDGDIEKARNLLETCSSF